MLHVAEQRYASGLSQRAHWHAEDSVTMVLAGTLRETVGRTDELAGPLSIVVKPAGTPHADLFGPSGARTLRIVIAEGSVDWCTPGTRVGRTWRWSHAGPAVPAFLVLLQAVRRRDGEGMERAAYDVLAAIAPDALARGPAPRWLQPVREAIEAEAHPPRVRQLAADAQVHPVYLARCFRRYFGCSITEYVQRRRVQRAAGAMVSSPEPLSRVAGAAGFADQPHLCRAFRRRTGITPSAFRALARS